MPRNKPINRNLICEIKGCKDSVAAKGLCRGHYNEKYVRMCKEAEHEVVHIEKEKEPWETSGFFSWDNASEIL